MAGRPHPAGPACPSGPPCTSRWPSSVTVRWRSSSRFSSPARGRRCRWPHPPRAGALPGDPQRRDAGADRPRRPGDLVSPRTCKGRLRACGVYEREARPWLAHLYRRPLPGASTAPAAAAGPGEGQSVRCRCLPFCAAVQWSAVCRRRIVCPREGDVSGSRAGLWTPPSGTIERQFGKGAVMKIERPRGRFDRLRL